MEILVLGTLEVLAGDDRLDLGGQRQQVVLALLALEADRVIQVDRLAEALYGEERPPTARVQVQICISALRRLFAAHGHPDAILTRSQGYRLQLGDGSVDLQRYEAALGRARQLRDLGRAEEAAEQFRAAAALWRGPVLDGIDSRVVRSAAVRITERRLTATEERVELELGLGRHRELVDELVMLVDEHPLRARLREHLMLALYRSGRHAEAVDAYRSGRRIFVDELGLEPNEELRRLEHAILTADPRLTWPEQPAAADPVPVVAAPRLLPTDIADFTGRGAQIDAIEQQFALATGFAVPVVVMAGKPGVGKTTLAVHTAHRLAARYPDGQLFADLHGRHGDQVGAVQVLERFLRALGVPGPQVPAGLDECAELYRALLSERRMLVVLDNAGGESQVRPLLPGTAQSAVLITSRRRLAGLPGAVHVDIDVFDAVQSARLLSRIAGADRVDAEPGPAAELAELCGHLPLALRIAGVRLAARPHWSVEQLADRLSIEARRLDELNHGGMGVRASIALTYDHLGPDARRLLRLLTIPDLPHCSDWTAAALLDVPLPDAQDLLDELTDAQLLEAGGAGRGALAQYRLHDLIRVFAREHLLAEEPAADRDAALERVLGALLFLTGAAHRGLYGGDYVLVRSPAALYPLPGPAVRRLLEQPLTWLERERHTIVAAVAQAARAGLAERCWGLAMSAVTLFESRHYLNDWRETHRLALAATRQAGDARGEAVMRYSIGTLHVVEQRFDEALADLAAAQELFERIGDAQGVALVERNVGYVDRMHGRYAEATARYERALDTFRRDGDLVAVAYVLNSLAQVRLDQHDVEAARALLVDALDGSRRSGSRRVEAQVLHRLSELHLQAGEPRTAAEILGQALTVVRALRDPVGEAYVLLGLGTAGLRAGDLGGAGPRLREALRLAQATGERLVEARVWMVLGELATAEGEPGRAAVELHRSLRLLRAIRTPQLEARVLDLLEALDGRD